MSYLLDSDVFIQARNLHYGLDFCPAFWDWLIAANANGLVFSTEKVGDEILGGADDLATWAGGRGNGFFLKPDGQEHARAEGSHHGQTRRTGGGLELTHRLGFAQTTHRAKK